jgi:hypothetical protein
VGRKDETSRRQCMKMFTSFCVLLGPVVPTASSWIARYLDRQQGKEVPPLRSSRSRRGDDAKAEKKSASRVDTNLPSIVHVFEKGGIAGAIKIPPPDFLSTFKGIVNRAVDVTRCEDLIEWFDSLATSLDCYYWFTESKLSPNGPKDLLDPDGDSTLLQHISDFLAKVLNWLFPLSHLGLSVVMLRGS